MSDPGPIAYEAVNEAKQPTGNLRIRLAPLAQPDDPYRSYNLELELQRPAE